MNDVAAFRMVGFMRVYARVEVREHVFCLLGRPRAWSEAGLRLYASRRAVAAAVVRSALALDYQKACLVGGRVEVRAAGDEAPGFDLRGEAALDLYTAEATLLAHDLAAELP